MADDDQEIKPYKLINETGEEFATSKGFTGKGIAEYPGGDRYDGEFNDGRRHGKGTYTYANGDIYVGRFEKNVKQGIGKLTYANNKGSYYGYFKAGKREGEGIFHYANKDRYSGAWKNELKHGYGTYIIDSQNIKVRKGFCRTNLQLAGEWFEGQLLHGSWTLPSGDQFEGEFKYNKPTGKGVWTLANGNQVRGEYSQNFLDIDVPNVDTPVDPVTKKRISLDWTTKSVSKPLVFPKRFNDQEKARFRHFFNDVDKDSSGQIDKDELHNLLVTLGFKVDEKNVAMIVQTLDIDNTGTLSFEEFLEFVYQVMQPPRLQIIQP